jgi:hypothetical protein
MTAICHAASAMQPDVTGQPARRHPGADAPHGDAGDASERRRGPRATRYRPAWIVIGMVGLGALVFIHLAGGPHHVLTFHEYADKPEHVFAFGAAMLWFGQLYRRGVERLLVCLCLTLAGIVLEFVQHALGTYDLVEYGDMAADAIGALVGWALLHTRLDHLIARFDAWLARRMTGR